MVQRHRDEPRLRQRRKRFVPNLPVLHAPLGDVHLGVRVEHIRIIEKETTQTDHRRDEHAGRERSAVSQPLSGGMASRGPAVIRSPHQHEVAQRGNRETRRHRIRLDREDPREIRPPARHV